MFILGVLHDVLPMYACHLLLVRPWLYDNHVTYDGYANTYSLKHNAKSLTLAPLPPLEPLKAKLGKGSKKSPHKSETREECTTCKSKPRIGLITVMPNTSDGGEPLRLITHKKLEDEIPKEPVPKVLLPIKIVLGEKPL